MIIEPNAKFNHLTVLYKCTASLHRHKWVVQCVCGVTFSLQPRHIPTKFSCGCIAKDNTPVDHPLKATWMGMRKRCQNPNDKKYANYGGRGINIDPNWDDFNTFANDMGEKPSPEHTLDRIDNNKGYSKDNCRWATKKEQAANTRSSQLFFINGELMALSAVVEKYKISSEEAGELLKKGMVIMTSDIKPPTGRSRENVKYIYGGESLTLTELSVKYKVTRENLRARLIKGMTIEDAIEYVKPKPNRVREKRTKSEDEWLYGKAPK